MINNYDDYDDDDDDSDGWVDERGMCVSGTSVERVRLGR